MPVGRRPSQVFARLASACAAGPVTLGTLIEGMGPRDHALLTLLLGMCFLHPIPMLGISVIFGSVIAVAGGRMAWGLGPWVPRRWMHKPLPRGLLARVFSASSRVFKRAESLIHPRGAGFAGHPWALRGTGLAVALCGLLIMVPLPPPTNMPPATAIVLLSVGVLEEDALILGLGAVAFLANIAMFTAIAVFGFQGVAALLVS